MRFLEDCKDWDSGLVMTNAQKGLVYCTYGI